MITLSDLDRALQPLRARLLGMVVRGVLKSVADAKGVQVVTISALAGEEKPNLQRAQNYGFTSKPPPGSEVLALCLGGTRENMIVISAEHRASRPRDLEDGEAAAYTVHGHQLLFDKAGKYRFGGVEADDPFVRKSDLDAFVEAYNAFVQDYRNHAHAAEPGLQAGSTAVTGNTSTAYGATGGPGPYEATASDEVFGR